MKPSEFIERELKYSAHNYHPLPVVLDRGQGVFMWDVQGRRYFDFLSGYSAVNQGHCHPRIVGAMVEQAQRLTLTSRAFHSSIFGEYAQFVSQYFGYDKLIPSNSGVEAVETALKLARRWGYDKKGVGEDRAKIVVCNDNFHGRTLAAISISTDPDSYDRFGPLATGFVKIPFDDTAALEVALRDEDVVAFMVEPIQGEAGIVVPRKGYLARCAELCRQRGVLLIADEVQVGIGRTGRLLCSDHDGVRPDIVILGKALSGGVYPVSATLADDPIMMCIKPGQHGSTFGGNPVACAVAMEALRVLKEEGMVENATVQGELFRAELLKIKSPALEAVRGKGLLNAVVIKPMGGKMAWDLCLIMKEKGLLAKPTHDHIIRLAPPLIITGEQVVEAVAIVRESLEEYCK